MIIKDQSLEVVDYEKAIEIAEGIYWVGFTDDDSRLHCNPYLIVEGKEAVLIDGGSRPDFSSVTMKILQVGVKPRMISHLIYQHYDPDLCGSSSNFETLIGRKDLRIISHRANNVFIKYYGVSATRLCIETMKQRFRFTTGRTLTFHRTPYAHVEGSFMTFDEQTGTLFSSDLFGSYDQTWRLFLRLYSECASCDLSLPCQIKDVECPFPGILDFHTKIMTSRKALGYAISQIKQLPLERIAPQHGSVIDRKEDIRIVLAKLESLPQVGIDAYLAEGDE